MPCELVDVDGDDAETFEHDVSGIVSKTVIDLTRLRGFDIPGFDESSWQAEGGEDVVDIFANRGALAEQRVGSTRPRIAWRARHR